MGYKELRALKFKSVAYRSRHDLRYGEFVTAAQRAFISTNSEYVPDLKLQWHGSFGDDDKRNETKPTLK